jgi:hypothetical protein
MIIVITMMNYDYVIIIIYCDYDELWLCDYDYVTIELWLNQDNTYSHLFFTSPARWLANWPPRSAIGVTLMSCGKENPNKNLVVSFWFG